MSALVTTYNRRAHICRAIDSILRQTCPVDEIVVVDDGSTDGTSELLREKYGDAIRVVTQENQGISAARRRAVLESSGTWIAFLDSDDEWTPDRNQAFQKIIVGIPEDVAWVFGDTAVVRDEGIVGTIFKRYAAHMDVSSRVLGDSMSVQLPFQLGFIQSSLYRRSALLAVNCFSEGLNHS